MWFALLAVEALACDTAKLDAARAELGKAPTPALQRAKVVGAIGDACALAPGIEDATKAIPSASATDATKFEAKAAQQVSAARKATKPVVKVKRKGFAVISGSPCTLPGARARGGRPDRP